MAIVIGTNGGDDLGGTAGNDTINGLDGDDWLAGHEGADVLNGGRGWDIASYYASDVGVTVNLATGRGSGGHAEGDRLFNIEGIEGSSHDDVLTGDAGSNVLFGGDGDDQLHGGGVSAIDDWDYIYGGAGDDTIVIKGMGAAVGGAGNDRIIGEWSGAPDSAELDYVSAEYRDASSGIFANLTASGGDNTNGFQVADGQGGTDLVSGVHQFLDSDFDDIFHIDSTYLVNYGGDLYNEVEIRLTGGDDIVIATDVDNASISYANAGGAVYIDMQAGTATDLDGSGFFIGNDTFSGISRVRGSSFDDEMHGSDGNDHLRGRGGNDWIFGGDGDDIIYGDERASRPDGGNDFLEGGNGADRLYGGSGFDTAFYGNSATGVTVNLTTGIGSGGEAEGDQLFDIEAIVGSLHNDILTGDAGSNELYGNDGNDQLYGGGVTTIDDWDYIEGGAGDDYIVIQGMGEARGGLGNDWIVAQWSGAPEAADLDYVVANYSEATSGIFADLTANGGDYASGFAVADGLGGTDRVFGVHRIRDGAFDDTFHIDATYLVNYGGNLYNDIEIMLTQGDDTVVATGVANASISYANAGGAVYVDMQAGTATDLDGSGLNIGTDTFSGISRVRGSSFDDEIHGSDGNDHLRGRGGNDTINGGDGNDIIYGDERADSGFGGDDILIGGRGYDQIFGGAGWDTAVLNGLDGAGHEIIQFNGVVYALDRMDHSYDIIQDVEFFTDGVQSMYMWDIYAPTDLDILSYSASYDDLAQAFRTDIGGAVQYYLNTGFFEGREASFDAAQYLANWGDLSAAFGSDLVGATVHFLSSGVDEHRLAEDPLDYIASYADLSGAFAGLSFEQMKVAGLSHYQSSGWNEGRRGGINFDADQYLANNGDVAAYFDGDADLATWHFIIQGRDEGRMWEDPLQYIASFGDLITAFGSGSEDDIRADALAHFRNASAGEQAARRGQIDFNADQYLANYEDLRAAFADGYGGYDEDAATLHFIRSGYAEGRTDDPLILV